MKLEFEITVPRTFTPRITNRAKDDVKEALQDLSYRWKILFLKQIRELQPIWAKLSPRYLRRKQREFAQGKIQSIDKLRRTNTMLKTYVSGVRVVESESSVEAPYGTSYAYYHQHSLRATLPRREFDLEEFEQIALEVFKKKLLNG